MKEKAIALHTGTIPAYAGESVCGRIISLLNRDHPRLRGGTLEYRWHRATLRGPSPPKRGNLRH